MEFENYQKIALIGFLGAMVFGAIASRTQFCTMGAVSDWVNMGSKTRFKVWVMAMGIALIGAQMLNWNGLIDLRESIYLSTSFTWFGHILGGFLFGIGMSLGAGCGQRTLVRLGGGNLKSLVLLLVLGFSAYMTLRGLLALVRLEINEPTVMDLSLRDIPTQGIPDILSYWTGVSPALLTIVFVTLMGGGALFYALSDRNVRSSFDNLLAGIGLGLLIVGAWYTTGVIGFDDFDPVPLEGASFIAPVGNTLSYLMTFTGAQINFGIAIALGLIVGAFVYSILGRSFRIEYFAGRSDLVNHLYAGVLMGFGGVLGLGCTIGQGVTGLSTLAIGSLITVISIILGSAFTMKMQFYLYDNKGWWYAFRSTVADIRPGQ